MCGHTYLLHTPTKIKLSKAVSFCFRPARRNVFILENDGLQKTFFFSIYFMISWQQKSVSSTNAREVKGVKHRKYLYFGFCVMPMIPFPPLLLFSNKIAFLSPLPLFHWGHFRTWLFRRFHRTSVQSRLLQRERLSSSSKLIKQWRPPDRIIRCNLS